jgi:hypothetical protein
MKKKAKRYQEGGVLRDRFGNPVRSGSGEIVRTRFPEKSYDEQASAEMTESSDYTGRRAKSPEAQGSSEMMPRTKVSAADIGFTGDDEEPRTLAKYMRSSPKEDVSSVQMTKEEVKVSKPKKPKRLSGMFGTIDEEAIKERGKTAATGRTEKKEPPLAKIGRALAGSFSADRAFKNYAESTPYARAKMGMKSGGKVHKMAGGGKTTSASKRADGIAQRGKTRGRIC